MSIHAPDTPSPENCPTPAFHETHYYCPSCTWIASDAPKSETELLRDERDRLKADLAEAQQTADRYRDALIEADIYLASLGWWEIGNLARVGEIIGEAIGWNTVAEINAQHAPSGSGLRAALKGNST